VIEECRVYWADPRRAPIARLMPLLDRSEYEKSARRLGEERDRYVVAHALLRLALAEWLQLPATSFTFSSTCEHCGGPHGPPRLVGVPDAPSVSLTHSGWRVAVAIANRARVGIDVERLERNRDDVAFLQKAALSLIERGEIARLAPAARPRALLCIWTRKEALLKATGRGLAISPELLTMSASDAPPALVAWDARDRPASAVFLRDLDFGSEHVGCLAVLGAPKSVSIEDSTARLADAVAPSPS
jgi:4'-phosphopantetheinyl transferase